uniref:Rpn family recombination-promoting nuclease/putative transposase n=1 Tax=Acetatifactor sp. TaxID=1872090 RepID=UPI004056E90F
MDMYDAKKVIQADDHPKEGIILNSKLADSSSKIIFDDPILCSQFLRDYIELPCFKDIRPEDIEDVSDQYVPLFAEERNADRVKRVNIKNESPFFLISLIEHKSKVDYNVAMQIFRYMVYIWEAYAKEAEKIQKDVTKLAYFKYPPILPIVYYEGSDNWTVPFDFRSRIIEGDIFGKYVPNFEYYLVPLRKYSNEDLLEKKDEISLVMLINRMQNDADIEEF